MMLVRLVLWECIRMRRLLENEKRCSAKFGSWLGHDELPLRARGERHPHKKTPTIMEDSSQPIHVDHNHQEGSDFLCPH